MNAGRLTSAVKRLGLAAAQLAAVAVVAVVLLTVWRVIGLPAHGTGELVAEVSVLLSAVGLVGIAATAWATILYAASAREMVLEMRSSRLDDQIRAGQLALAGWWGSAVEAATHLRGAANDVVGRASELALLRRRRLVWRTRSLAPLHEALVRAANATDEVSWLVPGEVAKAAEDLMRQLMTLQQLAIRGSPPSTMREGSSVVRRLKEQLATRLDAENQRRLSALLPTV